MGEKIALARAFNSPERDSRETERYSPTTRQVFGPRQLHYASFLSKSYFYCRRLI